MSTPLSVAIYNRLIGAEALAGRYAAAQQALMTLLTTGVNDGAPLTFTDPITGVTRERVVADAVRLGSKGGSLVWPEVVFRPSPGIILQGFADGTMAVDLPAYDFEIWDNTQSGTLITDIGDNLELLLDYRRGAPELPLSDGRAYHLETFMSLTLFADPGLNAWFGLWRARATEGRF